MFFPLTDEIEEDVVDNTFKGREVVEIVIKFGVELPRVLFGVGITEAAFANNEPVRLLKAGTVVSCIGGEDTDIFVTTKTAIYNKINEYKIKYTY